MACIFCEIIEGKQPAHKIYEDEHVISILIPRPIRQGHSIVVTKEHYENFIDLSDELASHVVKVGNLMGQKLKKLYSPPKIGVVVSGFGVAHFHYHVIPLFEDQDISSSAYVQVENGKLSFSTEYCPKVDEEVLKNISQEIQDA